MIIDADVAEALYGFDASVEPSVQKFLNKKYMRSLETLVNLCISTVKGMNFAGANFYGVALNGITFVECNFAGANFDQSQLADTKFIDCNMGEVNYGQSGGILFDYVASYCALPEQDVEIPGVTKDMLIGKATEED